MFWSWRYYQSEARAKELCLAFAFLASLKRERRPKKDPSLALQAGKEIFMSFARALGLYRIFPKMDAPQMALYVFARPV